MYRQFVENLLEAGIVPKRALNQLKGKYPNLGSSPSLTMCQDLKKTLDRKKCIKQAVLGLLVVSDC